MNPFINWLLSQTPDGATWLQVIIATILLCSVIYLFYRSITESSNNIKKGDDNISGTNN